MASILVSQHTLFKATRPVHRRLAPLGIMALVVSCLGLTGCVVADVASAGVSVGATAVKAGAKVTGAAINVGAGAVDAVTPDRNSDRYDDREDYVDDDVGAPSPEDAPGGDYYEDDIVWESEAPY